MSQGVLTYSQSTNPNSPHYSDQTRALLAEGLGRSALHRASVIDGTIRATIVSEGKEDCKRGGWRRAFERPRFTNQGACVSYFANLLP